MTAAPLRYVALGDSYTIGTSVDEAERWPNQLVEVLRGSAAPLELAANLAVNGFTSANLVDVQLPVLDRLAPEFISVLIGVNDVVQGVPPERYRRNVEQILDDTTGRVGAGRVIAITTPDYTVTPSGARFGDPARQASGIRWLNGILAQVAAPRGVAVVDIYDLSLRAARDPSLVARDGLHPSAAHYALWVERIAEATARLLST
jgi:acyl-CoA thioesterase-1